MEHLTGERDNLFGEMFVGSYICHVLHKRSNVDSAVQPSEVDKMSTDFWELSGKK